MSVNEFSVNTPLQSNCDESNLKALYTQKTRIL